MSITKEFKEFTIKGNVVDLAVAVVIGGAFGKIVTALVADLIMPLVGAVLPGDDWRTFQVTALHFKIGDFLGTVVDFLLIALALFLVVVKLGGRLRPKVEAPVTTKTCPECLEVIPAGARLCKACRSAQPS